jgi:hypothetical protein
MLLIELEEKRDLKKLSSFMEIHFEPTFSH